MLAPYAAETASETRIPNSQVDQKFIALATENESRARSVIAIVTATTTGANTSLKSNTIPAASPDTSAGAADTERPRTATFAAHMQMKIGKPTSSST